jgi:UDP-glucuronate 4-epimerase
METILITGGAGFIGSHLADRLLERGERIICVDNFDPYYDPKLKMRNIESNLGRENFSFMECDIRDKEDLEAAFRLHSIDKVVHLAARAGVRASIQNPVLYQEININGTISLLELSKEYQVASFIFASSSSVYGSDAKIPFSETDNIPAPISPYGVAKRACELLCYVYHHLYYIPIACLRFFTVYGPRQRPDMATRKFTALIDRGEEVPIYGDGTSQRDYTYISDIVDGIISALGKKFDYEIINLGNSKAVALKYLVSLIEANLGKKAKIVALPPQPGDIPVTRADISKAQRLLNYNPQVDIEDGVEKFVHWYKQQL